MKCETKKRFTGQRLLKGLKAHPSSLILHDSEGWGPGGDLQGKDCEAKILEVGIFG